MPGIAIGNCIPFNRGGVSWSSYWATLISATVETAAPTHVVLTFPNAQTSLGATDFTIAGFTVSSASWTGVVLTLVLSTKVTVFHGNLILKFEKTGTTTVVTNNVADDGKSIWYNWQTEIGLTGSDVTSWGNRLSAGTEDDLTVAAGYPVVAADGIYFQKSKAARISKNWVDKNQPQTVYLYIKTEANTNGRFMDDERNGKFTLGIGSSNFYMTANNSNFIYATAIVDAFCLIRAKFNGENSSLQVNDNVATTGNVGIGPATGLSLGARSDGWIPSESTFKDVVIRLNDDDAETYAAVAHGIRYRNGFFF